MLQFLALQESAADAALLQMSVSLNAKQVCPNNKKTATKACDVQDILFLLMEYEKLRKSSLGRQASYLMAPSETPFQIVSIKE